jgi:bifunctional non-homologous end joining protein LigD
LLDGTDLRSRPLIERRKVLAKLLEKAPENIRFSQKLRGKREELLQVARQFQLEGLIAKRPESLYQSGRRSGAWVKVKLTQQQEFVIGGYTPPEGSRKYFGSLLVGYYGPDGLLFAGRVGTGFSIRTDGDAVPIQHDKADLRVDIVFLRSHRGILVRRDTATHQFRS